MDIVSLLRKHHTTHEDFVVLKVDIEGAEFDVIRRLINAGMLNLIDVLAVEWHHDNPNILGHSRESIDRYTKQFECLNWMLNASDVTTQSWARRW